MKRAPTSPNASLLASALMYRGNRFCSDRCRDFYNSGAPGYDHDWRQPKIGYRWRDGRPMKEAAGGFRIGCACCAKEFDSRGPRCCSVVCERRYRERQDNIAVWLRPGSSRQPSANASNVALKSRHGATVARSLARPGFARRNAREKQKCTNTTETAFLSLKRQN